MRSTSCCTRLSTYCSRLLMLSLLACSAHWLLHSIPKRKHRVQTVAVGLAKMHRFFLRLHSKQLNVPLRSFWRFAGCRMIDSHPGAIWPGWADIGASQTRTLGDTGRELFRPGVRTRYLKIILSVVGCSVIGKGVHDLRDGLCSRSGTSTSSLSHRDFVFPRIFSIDAN